MTTPTATHGRHPHSLAVAHLNQFTDATPLKEGCEPFTCTERVGGEHSEQCAVSQRVFAKIDASGDCWVWTGALAGKGYGHVQVGPDKWKPAHRAVYELLVGPIAPGLQIDHLCRNRRCVNPDHLEPVTGRTNLLRSPLGAGARARRTHCPNGHEYTVANTIVSKRNQRTCRTCKNDRGRQRYEARRCYLCRRDVSDGLFVNVDFGLHVEHVCEHCWEKGNEGIEMPLDMTEDVWDA